MEVSGKEIFTENVSTCSPCLSFKIVPWLPLICPSCPWLGASWLPADLQSPPHVRSQGRGDGERTCKCPPRSLKMVAGSLRSAPHHPRSSCLIPHPTEVRSRVSLQHGVQALTPGGLESKDAATHLRVQKHCEFGQDRWKRRFSPGAAVLVVAGRRRACVPVGEPRKTGSRSAVYRVAP